MKHFNLINKCLTIIFLASLLITLIPLKVLPISFLAPPGALYPEHMMYEYLEKCTNIDEMKELLTDISRSNSRVIAQTPEESARSTVECDVRKNSDREELKVLSRIISACAHNRWYGNELQVFTERLTKRRKTSNRFKIGYRISRSKEMIFALDAKQDKKLTIEIVFAVYNNCRYGMMKPFEHPDGEDSLREKIRQLEDLFDGLDNFDWKIRIIDDGSNNGAGEYALKILNEEYIHYLKEGRIVVDFLEKAIRENLKKSESKGNPVLSGMRSARDSVKGGSDVYGMYEAAKQGSEIIIFTDSDNSSMLYFIADILWHLIIGNYDSAIGSRAMPDSIVLNRSLKRLFQSWHDTVLFNWFVIKPLLPKIKEIRDTQNGFKGFWADTLLTVLPKMQIKGAVFDVELIYLSKMFGTRKGVKEFGMPWIDNPGGSNFSARDGLKMRNELKNKAHSIINTSL